MKQRTTNKEIVMDAVYVLTKAGWTQDKMAKLSGYTRKTIGQFQKAISHWPEERKKKAYKLLPKTQEDRSSYPDYTDSWASASQSGVVVRNENEVNKRRTQVRDIQLAVKPEINKKNNEPIISEVSGFHELKKQYEWDRIGTSQEAKFKKLIEKGKSREEIQDSLELSFAEYQKLKLSFDADQLLNGQAVA